jgi:hypothetical protein
MMKTSGEINALLNLIEDPDEDIFASITSRFVGIGLEVIPHLDEYKLSCTSEDLIKKTECIISSIEVDVLAGSLKKWKESKEQSFLEASFFISMFLDRENNREALLFELERLRRCIWLELNDYLTPLEEVNILNKIIFGHVKLNGLEVSYNDAIEFDLQYLLATRNGNSYPLGALYMILGEMLGIPIEPIDIPKQNLLCYVEAKDFFSEVDKDRVLFFIDPVNGQVYTHRDIENYLKKINYVSPMLPIKPSGKKAYLQKWILEIARCAEEKENRTLFEGLKNVAELFRK